MDLYHGAVVRLGVVFVLCSLVTAGTARGDEFHGINAGAVVYGGMQFTEAKAAAIAATGTRAIRINFRLDWQTGRSSWSGSLLDDYDTIIDRARRYNLEVLGLFSNETTPLGQDQWNAPPDADGMNAYVNVFADTAYTLINRYRNDIKRWEIWNEPNCWSVNPAYNDPRNAGCTYILPAVYANLLAETYRECNYYNGRTLLDDYDISLCTGGLFAHEIGGSFSHAMDYMQQVYSQRQVWNVMQADAGRRYPWDFFGYHIYISGETTLAVNRLDQYINVVRGTKASNSDDTTILMTEMGWNSAACGEATQATNMRISFDHLEQQPDFDGLYWYQWVDEPYPYQWGITRLNGTRKPSYDEFVQQNADGRPQAPDVAITADRTNVYEGEVVRFTPAVTFHGSAVFEQAAWHVQGELPVVVATLDPWDRAFDTAGSYVVTLTVTDSLGFSGTSDAIIIHVDPSPFAPADFDRDGDVDQSDYGRFQVCFTGNGQPQTDPLCAMAKLDADADVDEADLTLFHGCMTGADIIADPACAD